MSLGVILDGLILIFLAVTIFYAVRLTTYLKTLRDGKKAFQSLIDNLSIHIESAENAIQALRESADSSGHDLQEKIKEASFLSDELRFMNEAGDGLANRLEKLAERNHELVELLENAGGIGHSSYVPAAEKKESDIKEKKQSFSIQDREFEEKDNKEIMSESSIQKEGFKSRAEQDLYEALQRKAKRKAGGVL